MMLHKPGYKIVIYGLLLGLLLFEFPAATAQTQQEDAASSRIRRLRLYEQVWRAIYDNYYDRNFNGVDWNLQRELYREKAGSAATDEELYNILRQMVGKLGDAHTRIYSPDEGFDRNRPSGTSVGLTVRRIEGKPVVYWVEYGSEAYLNGVRPGFIVGAINGEQTGSLLARIRNDLGESSTPTSLDLQSLEKLFHGPKDTTIRVNFLDHAGESKEVTLERKFTEFQRKVTVRQLPYNIGYIELTGFGPEIEREFDQAMQYVNTTQGLIIDLRNNGGGFVTTVSQIASYFLSPGTDIGEFINRQGRSTRRRTQKVRYNYSKPLVVIVSSRSASGSEIFAAAIQEKLRGIILGSNFTTCGCLLGVSRTLKLNDGWKLNVSDTDFRTASGRRIEGAGIRPDLVIELKIDDLIAGRDRSLEAAVDQISRSIAFGENAVKMEFKLFVPELSRWSSAGYSPASQIKR